MNVVNQAILEQKSYGRPGAILRRYEESHRKYHTLMHVIHFAQVATEIAQGYYTLNEQEVRALYTVAVYHDALYIPTSSTNETDSANLFKADIDQFASVLTLPKESVMNTIIQTIKGTKTHEKPQSLVEAICYDADLWGLGDTAYNYDRNRDKILQEYTPFYTLKEFLHGRIAFLERMLGRNSIYHTGPGGQREAAARDNMTKELSFNQELQENLL